MSQLLSSSAILLALNELENNLVSSFPATLSLLSPGVLIVQLSTWVKRVQTLICRKREQTVVTNYNIFQTVEKLVKC
ncbi:hypothetical protein C0J52_22527 [Blattella germanica]|nr:hypothetical protein C0J52_22527 [Blattella germanica]